MSHTVSCLFEGEPCMFLPSGWLTVRSISRLYVINCSLLPAHHHLLFAIYFCNSLSLPQAKSRNFNWNYATGKCKVCRMSCSKKPSGHGKINILPLGQ